MRTGVSAALAAAALISYISRGTMSAANTQIQAEFHLTNAQMGDILAAFSVGYFVFQMPGGWLSGRFGARWMLPLFSVVWSLCSAWSGLAGAATSLWWSRTALGFAQAGLFPGTARVLTEWVPQSERGVSSSLMAACMSLGGAVSAGLCARLMPVLGWRGVCLAFVVPGVIWALGFQWWFRNRPEQHPRVRPAELAWIQQGRAVPSAEAPPLSEALGKMVRTSSLWLICAQAFFRAFGAIFFLTWFTAYLEKSHGVTNQQAGYLTMLPLLGNFGGSLVGGWVVDFLLRKTGSKRVSRSGTSAVALVGCAVCLVLGTLAPNALTLTLILTLGSFTFGAGSPAAWAATMEICGRYTAVLFGLMNMCGNVGAFVSPKLVGSLVDVIEKQHLSWGLVLYLFAGIYVMGALCWAFVDPNRTVE